MNKKDYQVQILQILFGDACKLKHMPKQWRTPEQRDDDECSISRKCGRGTMDNGAAEHFYWLDDEYDYCERHYDCYDAVYDCPKYHELEEKVRDLVGKYRKMYPTSKVKVSIDGHKSTFYLDVYFELSDEDYNGIIAKIDKKKTTKKEDGGIDMSERGKEILTWMQEQPIKAYSAREVAEGLFCNPRAIPGAMKKLINDGFIKATKVGSAPYQYELTDTGATLVIEA